MKTLDQVEARTPIDATHTPGNAGNAFIIAQAGSYYLTGNLNVAKTNGIFIGTAGVTVDLNGFQIARTSGSGSGIVVGATANSCTIRNGSITGFPAGIAGTLSRGGAISHVIASNCSVGLQVGDGWGIEHCNVHDNSGDGINTALGCAINYCTASNNTGRGFSIGDGSTMVDCTASANKGFAGISTGSGCTLTHCTARLNTSASTTSAGITTGIGCTITACTAEANTNTNATPTGATGAGINAGGDSKVQNCSASFNKGDGIRASSGCSIVANACSSNGSGGDGAGVHVTSSDNRLEGNNVTSNIRGIDVDTPGNLIIKNSAKGNTTNYTIVAGNAVGPIVAAPSSAAISGSTGGAGVGSTDPWANFSY